MGSLGINPSAQIPFQKFRSEEKLENEDLKADMDKIEEHEKRLALLIVRLDRVEERLDKKVKELDLRLEELGGKLQAFSTLTSHMEMILEESRRTRQRT